MAEDGRPIFMGVTRRLVSETPGDRDQGRYPILVEEFVFEVASSYGDVLKPVAMATDRVMFDPAVAAATDTLLRRSIEVSGFFRQR